MFRPTHVITSSESRRPIPSFSIVLLSGRRVEVAGIVASSLQSWFGPSRRRKRRPPAPLRTGGDPPAPPRRSPMKRRRRRSRRVSRCNAAKRPDSCRGRRRPRSVIPKLNLPSSPPALLPSSPPCPPPPSLPPPPSVGPALQPLRGIIGVSGPPRAQKILQAAAQPRVSNYLRDPRGTREAEGPSYGGGGRGRGGGEAGPGVCFSRGNGRKGEAGSALCLGRGGDALGGAVSWPFLR